MKKTDVPPLAYEKAKNANLLQSPKEVGFPGKKGTKGNSPKKSKKGSY